MISYFKLSFRNTLLIISAFILSSCSFFSPAKIEVPTKHVLNTIPAVPCKRMHKKTLMVQLPETQQAYNTTQMAYSIRPHQIAYFSKNQWAEKPSQMLQPLLIRTLQKTHYFRAVVTQLFMGHYDYVLSTQILELQQDFTHYPAILRLSIYAQLTQTSTNRVIASKLFTEQQRLVYQTPYSGVIAANKASQRILHCIALFCSMLGSR